jgi:mono/diheme cytochrome c family protein
MSTQSKPSGATTRPPASRKSLRWSIAAWLVGALVLILAMSSIAVYTGVYDVAADVPHSQPVYWLLQTIRERSIGARARDVVVPADLNNPKRIASGAAEYADMCSGCHLAPGKERTEISRGLYPRAPELRRGSSLSPAEEFWVVKHGIKATGMAAWGVTHDDELLWDVVAFLRKLPELTADQYQTLVKSAPKSHEEMMQEMQSRQMDHDGY